MLNFNELQPIINDKYSFVGIDKRGSQLRFCLPKGFNPDLFVTFNSKRNLFFCLYKVLRQFKNICIQKGYLQATADRDGVIQSDGSVQKVSLPNAEDEEGNILYSKLDAISAILNLYDEPKILFLSFRLGRTEKIDYSKIHQYLHRAVYLNNGAVYVDAMTLPRQQVQYQSTDIVAMYCYILWEIKQQLDEEITPQLQALAENFQHRYVDAEYSLFHQEYCTLTVNILKDTLEIIESHTPLKDADYWQFHNAIELFLYGELSQQDEGKIWGIKNFHSVWESMCLTYLAKRVPSEYILYMDTRFLADDVAGLANTSPKVLDLANVFRIKNTQLVPDAVIIPNWFNKQRQGKTINYSLKKDVNNYGIVWNDFGYETTFYCTPFNSAKEICLRIAYEGQSSKDCHTFAELEKFYSSQKGRLTVNSQLPSNFYSFWDIDSDDLNSQMLWLMFQLNHVFYIALKKGICTASKFKTFLYNDLDVNYSNNNVLNVSLLRNYTQHSDKRSDVIKMFEQFIYAVSYLKIIDVKYQEKEYFLDNDNTRSIKEKDIRKQFVYEYLLQQAINNQDTFKNLEVKSYFWLPSYQNNSRIINECPDYFNEYISLEDINFAAIVDMYIAD
jgi:hypothetical protein